jgi:hypothetical protein
MATTFVKIASSIVGSGGAATIDFGSIPQTYRDLKIVVSARWDQSGSATFGLRFNSSTTNYSRRWLSGNGASASSGNDTSGPLPVADNTMPGTNYTASVFGSVDIYIPNYTSANYKSVSSDGVAENNGTTAFQTLTAGLWSDTAAITSVALTNFSGAFAQYTTATLYGIKSS